MPGAPTDATGLPRAQPAADAESEQDDRSAGARTTDMPVMARRWRASLAACGGTWWRVPRRPGYSRHNVAPRARNSLSQRRSRRFESAHLHVVPRDAAWCRDVPGRCVSPKALGKRSGRQGRVVPCGLRLGAERPSATRDVADVRCTASCGVADSRASFVEVQQPRGRLTWPEQDGFWAGRSSDWSRYPRRRSFFGANEHRQVVCTCLRCDGLSGSLQ
jgi:hypothetical protein